MALKIRLARGGSKKKPFYRVVVSENTSPRDGRFVERVGSYNPLLEHDNKDRFVINEERTKHWLSNGAKPTDRVYLLLSKAGLVEKKQFRETPKKSAPGKKAQEKIKEAQENAKEKQASA